MLLSGPGPALDPLFREQRLRGGDRLIDQRCAWGIHPEGTRFPDGRLYRGRTGAVRVALATGAPLVPVAITDTTPELAGTAAASPSASSPAPFPARHPARRRH